MEQAEEIRYNLRKTLDNIEKITGISKTLAAERDDHRWAMKVSNLFNKANDELADDSKYQSIISETLDDSFLPPPNYVTEDLSKYHYAISFNPVSTWRGMQRQSSINKLIAGLKENTTPIISTHRNQLDFIEY